ncbi:hypothetical protein AR276_20795 [Stenotrophomonas maltophilia]|nr:hypothetical protein AR276_20795 [Stenotrophomonas maltophilia]
MFILIKIFPGTTKKLRKMLHLTILGRFCFRSICVQSISDAISLLIRSVIFSSSRLMLGRVALPRG